MTPGIMFLSLIFVGISLLVSFVLKSKFRAYSEIPTSSGLTGKQIAEKMLKDNQIYGVQVRESEGFLSDHYNPADKTVNLSPDVYNGANVAAAAVAAHECGHAVQHAAAYPALVVAIDHRELLKIQLSRSYLDDVTADEYFVVGIHFQLQG